MNIKDMEVTELIGKTLTKVEGGGDRITFYCEDGSIYKLYHEQDCCENVSIEDINGDLQDLVGKPILMAEEVSDDHHEEDFENSLKDGRISYTYAPDSYTWTFYKFATIKGYVDVRWFGESNGYYSESVDFIKIK